MSAFLLALLAALQAAAPAPSANTAPTTTQINAQIVIAQDRQPIPFEYDDNLIVFRAEIGGKPVWMLLDTGASHNIVDTELATQLGLKIIPMAGVVHGTGGHDIPKLRVDDVTLVVPHAFSARLPMLAAAMKPHAINGHPILAVLGHDLLSHLSILVDKPAGLMTIATGRAKPNGSNSRLPIPVETIGDRDQVNVSVDGKPLKLTLDTGASAGLSLTPEAWARVKPKDAQVFPRHSMGAGGVPDTILASRLPGVKLGSVDIADADVRVGRENSYDHDGRVGMGILSRYSFVLDLAAGHLWLIPAPSDAAKLPPPLAPMTH